MRVGTFPCPAPRDLYTTARARLALALTLCTGQRRSDVIRLGKQHAKADSLWSGHSAAQRYRASSSSALVAPPTRFFSPGLSSSSTVPTAANPAATAASFAAFFAVALTFDGVIEGERFLLFATLFALVLPDFADLAPARLGADFADVRLDAFFMFPPFMRTRRMNGYRRATRLSMAWQGFSEPRISTHRLEDDRTLLGHRCPSLSHLPARLANPIIGLTQGAIFPACEPVCERLPSLPQAPLWTSSSLSAPLSGRLRLLCLLSHRDLHGVPSLLLSDSPVAGELNWAFDHREKDGV